MQGRRLIAIVAAMAVPPGAAGAQARPELRVWTARALATVLAEVGGEFERTSGYKVVVTSDLPAGFTRRASAGESFDVLISMAPTVDAWIRDGKVNSSTRTDVARSGIGVEVRAGAPKPDIGSVDALKRALLNARSIAYLRVGSGIYVDSLLERLGIADSVRAKVTRPESDIVSELVAKGEVELGIVVITQIMTTNGVELVGPLPAPIQSNMTFAAGVSTTSAASDVARELIRFLATPAATRVIKAQGMEPIR